MNRYLPWLAVVGTLVTGGLLQVGLYVYVMRRDRNHITQAGLGVGGLIPIVGAYILAEQALTEAGIIPIQYVKTPPSPPKPIVSTVSDYRRKVEEAEVE